MSNCCLFCSKHSFPYVILEEVFEKVLNDGNKADWCHPFEPAFYRDTKHFLRLDKQIKQGTSVQKFEPADWNPPECVMKNCFQIPNISGSFSSIRIRTSTPQMVIHRTAGSVLE